MKKLACLFPGQGAQSVGMGLDLFNQSEAAKQTFEAIDAIAGRSLSRLCFEGPEEELRRTANTQPTILAVSCAAWAAYRKADGPLPSFVAGHSLGEFSALYAAGAMSLEAVVKLVEERAALMESCPKGAMSAVIGVAPDKLSECCAAAQSSTGGVCIVANFNTREQLVISGNPEAVTEAGKLAKEAGGKVIPLPVGGAFHSPLMESAATVFATKVSGFKMLDADMPVVQNVDARPESQRKELTEKLSRQMPSAVRWYETIEYMLEHGVDTFVEIGPGKALAGMVKKINRQAVALNIHDFQSLNETVAALKSTASV